MSFYLGKDSNNTSILHVTKNITSSSSMKSATPLNNTVYHSNMTPLSAKVFNATSISAGPDYYILFPQEAIDYVFSSSPRRVFELVVNGKVHRYETWANVPDTANFWYNLAKTTYNNGIFDTARYTRTKNNSPITTAQLIVYDITTAGTWLTTGSAVSGVTIDSGAIAVGGTAISDIGFVVDGVVNPVDYTYYDDGNVARQIISPTTGNVILAAENGGTTITIGGKCILNSGAALSMFMETASQTKAVAYDVIRVGGASTINYKLFDLPGTAKEIFCSWFYDLTIDITVTFLVPNVSGTAVQTAVHQAGISTWRTYLYILNNAVYVRVVGTGNNADVFHFYAGVYTLSVLSYTG